MLTLPPDLHAFLFDDPYDDPILKLPETVEFLQIKSWVELLETLPRWKALEEKGLSRDLFSVFFDAKEIIANPAWRPYFGPVAHLVTPFWLACYRPHYITYYLQEENDYIYLAENAAPYIWEYMYFPLMHICASEPEYFPKDYLNYFVHDPFYLSARYALLMVYSKFPNSRNKLRSGLRNSLKDVRKTPKSYQRARRELPMIHCACYGQSDRSLIENHFRDNGILIDDINPLIERLLKLNVVEQVIYLPTIDDMIHFFAAQESFYPLPIAWSEKSFPIKSLP